MENPRCEPYVAYIPSLHEFLPQEQCLALHTFKRYPSCVDLATLVRPVRKPLFVQFNLTSASSCIISFVFMLGNAYRISPRSEGKTSWLTVLKNYLDEIKQPRPKLERKAIYIPSSTAASTVLSNIIVNAITTTFTQQSPSPPDAVASSSNAPPSDAVASSYVPPPVPIFTPFQESVHRYATALEDGANGYLSLAVEEKLQLLNMLCNDALNTTYELSLPV